MSKFKLTQTAAEVQDILNNSLQKPTGLDKTKLVGVGVNGQENIEIGDNLTLANGKLSATRGESLPSTIQFDEDGDMTVGKSLTVNENFSVNSFKNNTNIDGSPDNRYSQFNRSVYVPDSDYNTSSYAWHWITRKLDQSITGYAGFIEMHNWYELYIGSKQHNGYITCDFYIEWKSSAAYNGVSSIELPVGFNGWLLEPYKSWKDWAYNLDYYGGIVKMTTGGKEYPVSISVKDHTLHFTATGESITIPANTKIRFEGRFFQRRA